MAVFVINIWGMYSPFLFLKEQVINSLTVKFYSYYFYNRFTALCPGLPGWAGTTRNIHPLTYPDHRPTFISFFHLLQSV